MNQGTSGEEWFVRCSRLASTVQRRRDRCEGAIFVLDDGVNVTHSVAIMVVVERNNDAWWWYQRLKLIRGGGASDIASVEFAPC